MADRPEVVIPKRKVHTCTATDPWTPKKSERAIHPDATYVGDRDYGGGEYCVAYKCPHCGKSFEEELPQ